MKNIELETPIDELDEADLRETFSDVMAAHEENVKEYEELQADLEDATEYSERIDELEAEKELAVEYFADKASAVTNINEDVLAKRFSVDELVEMAVEADEQAAAFSETEESPKEDVADDDGDESIFADKEQKSPKFTRDNVDSRKEAARNRLQNLGGVSF